ncbi:hypothetical protein [sulfur-oxidizing endosymbiont of Gigantopelta aegis]|uniref:hypothetical protein n=1 Tax=sulfur-oxidizing endosymbiont of Gigantopelta aegis TaxID=2794934 RepID=UPI0018DD1439|nr:hypothetical protein [sulfur-oxidizing endosymbiont of Gigantopelta aegis]
MAYYNLIFQGKIIDGASLDEVKDNVARLFKADAAKTAALFSGKPIVIKKNLDTEAAKKYLTVLKKAGAIAKAVKVKAVKLDSETTAPQKETLNKSTPETSPAITSNNEQKGLSPGLASLIGYNQPKTLAEQEKSDNLKPVTESTQNEPAKDQSIPVKATPDKSTPNISGLQLAPIGSNHNEENSEKNSENPPIKSIPDTSHLSMSEAQSGSLEEFAPAVEAVELPDIDDLSMGEANTGSLEEL